MNQDFNVCRLCLKICGTDFAKVQEIPVKLLLGLPQYNLDVTNDAVFCKDCVKHLEISVEFDNYTKHNIESQLIVENSSNEDGQTTKIVTEKNSGRKSADCRFCRKSIKTESQKTFSVYIFLQKYFPEMDLTSTCGACLDFLQNHLLFTIKCLNTETLKKYIESSEANPMEEIDMYRLLQFKVGKEYGISCSDICKIEDSIEIYKPDQVYLEDYKMVTEAENKEVDMNVIVKTELKDPGENLIQEIEEETVTKYEEFDFKLEDGHELSQLDPLNSQVKWHACAHCSYKTPKKSRLTNHVIIHKDPSETKLYNCDKCSFQSKHKSSLKDHMIIHKHITEITLFHCPQCSFQTKYKRDLKRHETLHDNPSEAAMHNCEQCDFQTRYKSALKQHSLTHRSPGILKCHLCPYETKKQHYLASHVVKHDTWCGVTDKMYKCETCYYSTDSKSHFRQHLAMHTGEEGTHKCEHCSFQTKHKNALKVHSLQHKSLEDVRTYECSQCAYRSIRKSTLQRHLLTHMDLSEAEVYECGKCQFKTKRKGYIDQHMSRMHKEVVQ